MAGPSDEVKTSNNKSNSNKKMTKVDSFASQVQNFDFCGESIDISLR
jgi:hypothetical protein